MFKQIAIAITILMLSACGGGSESDMPKETQLPTNTEAVEPDFSWLKPIPTEEPFEKGDSSKVTSTSEEGGV